ncbi:tryptase-like [Ylistrum balloti]|uniref:tryptase-like n=1 Tax=Ylistrum balloti TaxID=509963 RepID=UPI002905C52F|nr:tryptase-like [Ylistrum balloti]
MYPAYVIIITVLVLVCNGSCVSPEDEIQQVKEQLQVFVDKLVLNNDGEKRDVTGQTTASDDLNAEDHGEKRDVTGQKTASDDLNAEDHGEKQDVTGQKTASDDLKAEDHGKRVVGGTPMGRNQWPWLVSLHFLRPFWFTEKTGMRHLCGGTLISTNPEWVITAAHCVSEEMNAGLGNPKHVNTLLYDIALLKLMPVELLQLEDTADLDEGEFAPGQLCSVAGWGQVSYRPKGWGNFIPLIASVSLVDTDVCSEQYEAVETEFYIDQSTICAASDEGHDACLGDSGGPLMCQSPSDDRWKLVGVVSSGYECGMKDFPGIYTRINYYRSWIDRVMEA